MSASETYYVHLADPSFHDLPWPGERRLGPYLTAEEAQNQAANDVAHGLLAAEAVLGIFTSSESDLRREDASAGTAMIEPAPILDQAATEREVLLAPIAAGIEDQKATLQAQLPEGVAVDDYLAAQASA